MGECIHDTIKFLCIMPTVEYVDWGGVQEGTFTFKTNYTLDQVREVLRKVPDGHVALQTVQLLELYTGLRDFSIT